MRLLALKVSIPVLMLVTFHTGSCGILSNLVELGERMSNMTPQQQIRAREDFYRELRGEVIPQPVVTPAQPAPAPQPVATPVQSAPSSRSVPAPAIDSAPVMISSQQSVSAPANESGRSTGHRILNALGLGKSTKNKKVSQLDSATEQPANEDGNREVEGVLKELEANTETIILDKADESGKSEDVRKTTDENEESESNSVSWLQKMFNHPSREGSTVDEESSQSEVFSDEESENSDRE